MAWNREFFRTFWPSVGPAVTAHRGGSRRDVGDLLRLLRLRPRARILDLPCGFGRHAVELARRGFRVTGVDISPALLAQARRAAAAAGVEVEFGRGDMRRLAFRGRFDAVLNLFTSFGYFGDAGDARVLGNFHQALRPAGRLLLHVVHRDWLLRHYQPQPGAVRMGSYAVIETRNFDFATSIVTTEWTARRGRRLWREQSRIRVYSCHELLAMLNAAGFSRVQCFGSLAGGPLRLDSRWLVALAHH